MMPLIKTDEYIAFDMYFASMCSMQVHPGAGTKGQQPLTFEQCRDKVFHMLDIRRSVFASMISEPAGEDDAI